MSYVLRARQPVEFMFAYLVDTDGEKVSQTKAHPMIMEDGDFRSLEDKETVLTVMKSCTLEGIVFEQNPSGNFYVLYPLGRKAAREGSTITLRDKFGAKGLPKAANVVTLDTGGAKAAGKSI